MLVIYGMYFVSRFNALKFNTNHPKLKSVSFTIVIILKKIKLIKCLVKLNAASQFHTHVTRLHGEQSITFIYSSLCSDVHVCQQCIFRDGVRVRVWIREIKIRSKALLSLWWKLGHHSPCAVHDWSRSCQSRHIFNPYVLSKVTLFTRKLFVYSM